MKVEGKLEELGLLLPEALRSGASEGDADAVTHSTELPVVG